MQGLSPEDRALFESEATALFEELVAQDGLRANDPRIAEGGPARAAFELLQRVGLLILDSESEKYVGVDPTTVQSRIVAPMSAEGADRASVTRLVHFSTVASYGSYPDNTLEHRYTEDLLSEQFSRLLPDHQR